MSNDLATALRDLKEALRQPIPDIETLVSQLSLALSALHLHPTSLPPEQISQSTTAALHRHLPSFQISLLTQVLPTFIHALGQKELDLVDRFFCPPKSNELGNLRLGRAVTSVTYGTVPSLLSVMTGQPGLPAPCRDYAIRLLDLLSAYGVDDLYWSIWTSGTGAEGSKDQGMRSLKWEESIKAITSLPAKVANAIGRWKSEGWKGDVPATLVPRSYFTRLTIGYENLMYDLKEDLASVDRLQLVLQRLAAIGLLSPASPMDIMRVLIPRLLYHLHPPAPLPPYHTAYLPKIFLGLSTSIIHPFVASLVANLPIHIADLTPDRPEGKIKQAAEILVNIVGPSQVGNEVWDAMIRSAITQTSRTDAQTRLIVAYIAPHPQEFIEAILSTWSSPKFIKYALYTPQFQLTYTLLLAISLLPPFHPYLVTISTRPTFLTACQSYLSHPDGSVRRLGLLVAEILSEVTIRESDDMEYDEKKETEELMQGLEVDEETGKPKRSQHAPKGAKRLRFGGGMWEGQGEGREEARWLRSSVGVKDNVMGDGDWMLGWTLSESSEVVVAVESTSKPIRTKVERGRTRTTEAKPPPKIVMLDEAQLADPLQSYSAPDSPGSRSPSPTPSYLEEIAADPSLALDATQKKKVTRPVYILQLLQLLRTKDNPDALEMAIKHGEGLIRAKREFGLELAENAIPLAGQLIGMSDQYKLEGWEERRQGMITALVACAPRPVAPYLAEQYFINQYSLQQKSIMLTALSMGARELAGLPIPDITTRRIDFPSKTLPPALHRRYASPADVNHQIEAAAEGVRGMLLDKGARKAAEVLPDIAREKRLRISSSKPGMAEVGSVRDRQLLAKQQPKPVAAFSEVAAEYFIMPLVNRFWTHFSDNHNREARAVAVGTRFRGAGAGLVMSPLALEKLLMTLSLLVHAAQNSPLFLAILAPEVIELGLTVGARHPHRPELEEGGAEGAESQVIGGALELILVALDISGEVDGGRTILLDKPELVMAAGEWARGIFEVENKGGQVVGGQGGREGRIKGAAAGVVVRVGEMVERWGGRR